MNSKKKKALQLASITCILLTCLGFTSLAVSAQEPNDLEQLPENVTTAEMLDTRSSRTYSLYRGSWLLWSRDSVRFNYSGGRVTSSSAYQECGWIFPNYIETRGITRTATSTTAHTYRATKYVSAGIPTPWGHVGAYGKTVSDHLRVNGNGTGTWW
jgi:hypothetical protein